MELNIAWVAGIIEGEGYFSSMPKYNSMSIIVSMTDLDVIQSLKDTTKVGNITGPYQDKRPNTKPMYKWVVTTQKDVLNLSFLIKPYLHERRLQQLNNCINLLKPKGLNRRNLNMNKTHCKRGHEFNEENTYYAPRINKSDGKKRRQCKICRKILTEKYRLQQG